MKILIKCLASQEQRVILVEKKNPKNLRCQILSFLHFSLFEFTDQFSVEKAYFRQSAYLACVIN